ncbi:MAG TPA: DNA cytosine methyltransferase [Oligoflexus sp.]|uniref:DNA cytosine methyltransferase n=1 Tax=Oligoflexus sp. TaxID=1971216 RepID=UPI002D2873A1|nr:DNA cytosine methyltransferase [Oligoflexus sp.]HYX35749.1 DNA cytosine methyltransferase [Oligoflexus sp.]
MLNALDLFSGYGGLSLALAPWAKPVAYCEIERYPQSILLSRMEDGSLPRAPLWDDVRTLDGKPWRGKVDIIYGGFPCQDISVAGTGAGLAGKRSGLFFEIVRLAEEIEPSFLFLENVAAIRLRGLDRVVGEFSARGYDCRWRMLSAQEIGAPHKRNRWFLLAAHADRVQFWKQQVNEEREGTAIAASDGPPQPLADAYGSRKLSGQAATGIALDRPRDRSAPVADTPCPRLETSRGKPQYNTAERTGWWAIEPGICRVVNGCPNRVDRIKALGNGVVPLQAREAFRSLMFVESSEPIS